jgi:hypothetical protein
MALNMDKLKLTGQTLGRVFNFRSGCMSCHALTAIRSNLELKTRPKQLLGSLPLDIALSAVSRALRLYQVQSLLNQEIVFKYCLVPRNIDSFELLTLIIGVGSSILANMLRTFHISFCNIGIDTLKIATR